MTTNADLRAILTRLEPVLGRPEGAPVPLDGGITNRNYRVRLGGEDYVIRLPGRDTALLGISREAERIAGAAAAELGIAPAGGHDLGWISRQLPDDGSVRVTDTTAAWACFGLWGPRARTVLAPLTSDPLDFPYMTMREIAVAEVPVRCLRVTFVGELGWELYCPTEYGRRLWEALWEAGQPYGVLAAGYRAIDSLRLEKGYRVWGSDITPDQTPLEAGLGFCMRRDKSFIGSDALGEPRTRLRCLVLGDPRTLALGDEPVRVAGRIAGRVTSGGYGYTVARSIAYAYLSVEVALGTAVEVDVFGEWVPGEVVPEPLYDPSGERIRG